MRGDYGRGWHLLTREGALGQIPLHALRSSGPEPSLGLPASRTMTFLSLSHHSCGAVPGAHSGRQSVALEPGPERGEKPPHQDLWAENLLEGTAGALQSRQNQTRPRPSLELCLGVSHPPSRSNAASAENTTSPTAVAIRWETLTTRTVCVSDPTCPQQERSLTRTIPGQSRQGTKEGKSHRIYHQTENKDILEIKKNSLLYVL